MSPLLFLLNGSAPDSLVLREPGVVVEESASLPGKAWWCMTDWGLVLCSVLPVMMAKEKPPITVVGDVGGSIAIIVVRSRVSFLCRDAATGRQ